MSNKHYFLTVLFPLTLLSCSSNEAVSKRMNDYCVNDALRAADVQPNWEGHPQYPHPSNDPAAMGAGEVSLDSGCYLGIEELDDLDP